MTAALESPIIILGTHRSGTTWLGRAFSRASDVAYWSEPRPVWTYRNWLREDDVLTARDARPPVVRHIQKRFAQYTRRLNKDKFCEKTPSNCLRIPFVKAVFPDARFILVLRDGRSVLRSAQEVQDKGGATWHRMWQRVKEARLDELPGHLEKLPLLFSKILGRQEKTVWGVRPPGWRQWLREDNYMVFLAKQWTATINRALDDIGSLPETQKIILRYEDLAECNAAMIEKMVSFSDVGDRQSVVTYIQKTVKPDRARAWRDQFDESLLSQIRPHLESTLNRMDYPW